MMRSDLCDRAIVTKDIEIPAKPALRDQLQHAGVPPLRFWQKQREKERKRFGNLRMVRGRDARPRSLDARHLTS